MRAERLLLLPTCAHVLCYFILQTHLLRSSCDSKFVNPSGDHHSFYKVTNGHTINNINNILCSVMAKLPATSYVRMVDIWLIFTQLYPFLEVILYTIIELYNEEEETNHHGFKRDIPETQRQKGKWKIIYILYSYIITYVFRIKPPILGFFQWTQTYTKFQKVLVSMKVFQRYYMD